MLDTPAHKVASRVFPTLRLDHLWAMLAVAVVLSFISLTPTGPNDFWWHLKAGELIATGQFPTTNLFTWTLPTDHPYVYQSWLGELLFYWLYQLGGLPLVVCCRNLLGAAAYSLVAVEAHRRSGSWRLAAVAVLLAGAMTINNFSTRTQNWSWVPFALTLTLLGRYVDTKLSSRWLLLLPVVMVFWVNLHGAFVLGLGIVGAFVAGETLRRVFKQPYALGWHRLRPLYIAAAGMATATLVNPQGLGIVQYVATILNDKAIQGLINEWQTPTPGTLAGNAFYLGVLAVICTFALQRRRPTPTDLLLVVGFAWQAFSGVRSVVWFGLAVMPIMVGAVASTRSPLAGTLTPSPRERGGGTLPNFALAALLATLVVALQPWFKPLLPLPQPYVELHAPVPGAPLLFDRLTPVAAVEHLREQPCAGPLFNELGYGSYIAWALYPSTRSFIDPRIELFPYELWLDYVALNDGRDLPALLDRYRIDCVFLDRTLQPRLATGIARLEGWTRSFGDGQSEVWRRS